MLFLIDTSKSIYVNNVELQKQFIINITNNWIINNKNFQVSVVSFSSDAKIEVSFEDVNKITDFHEKILNLEYNGQISNLHVGLSTAKNILDKRNRRVYFTKVQKYLIIFKIAIASRDTDRNQIH